MPQEVLRQSCCLKLLLEVFCLLIPLEGIKINQCQTHSLEISIVASIHCNWECGFVTQGGYYLGGNSFHELSNRVEFKGIDLEKTNLSNQLNIIDPRLTDSMYLTTKKNDLQ